MGQMEAKFCNFSRNEEKNMSIAMNDYYKLVDKDEDEDEDEYKDEDKLQIRKTILCKYLTQYEWEISDTIYLSGPCKQILVIDKNYRLIAAVDVPPEIINTIYSSIINYRTIHL